MNTLQINELRELLRSPEKRPLCTSCQHHPATDVHHIDENHSNNSPANLTTWCKRCHNEHHGISDNLTELTLVVRQFHAIQRQRIAMGNRIGQYERLGYDPTVARTVFVNFKEMEKDVLKLIAKMLKSEPIYTVYLSHILGVGPAISGRIITNIGDPGRFNRISNLWSYAGLGVQDGAAPKKRRGQIANWNQDLRMTVVGRLVPQFIKLKNHHDCFGRQLYDQYKRFYLKRDTGKISLGHIENRARRKVAKVFLSCLWVAWRRIKGMTVTEPYAADKLAHTHIITPEQWAGDDWFAEAVQLKM